MIKRNAVVLLIMSGLLLTGCGSKHLRKIDAYGQAKSRRSVDEADVAKSFGVSYTVYSRETNYIKQYRAYKAKQGIGTLGQMEWWLLARQNNMLPSELINQLLDKEQAEKQKSQ